MTFDRSFSFDRAVAYYDRTRSLDPELTRRVIDLLAEQLDGRRAVLEIGTGTGRLSLPLSDRGIPIVGMDLSDKMMAELIKKAGGSGPFPLIQADATRLPLRDSSCDGAIACWVLHLIPDWKRAVGEVARVLQPGGRFLVNQGGWGFRGWTRELQERFAEAAGTSLKMPGVVESEPLDAEMARLGAQVEIPDPLTGSSSETPGARISNLEAGMYSWTWSLDEEARRRAAESVRDWARKEFGSLDAPQNFDYTDTWRIYNF